MNRKTLCFCVIYDTQIKKSFQSAVKVIQKIIKNYGSLPALAIVGNIYGEKKQNVSFKDLESFAKANKIEQYFEINIVSGDINQVFTGIAREIKKLTKKYLM